MALSMLFGRQKKKLTPEEEAVRKGVQAPSGLRGFLGFDEYAGVMGRVSRQERSDYRINVKQAVKDFRKEEVELKRELAKQQKDIEGASGYNVDYFRKKAEKDERFADTALQRERMARKRYGKIEEKRFEEFEDRKTAFFHNLEREPGKNTRERRMAFRANLNGETPQRSITPTRRAA